MTITINIYYKGQDGSAHRFIREMIDSGLVAAIRAEEGNLRYEYFLSQEDEETILLVDRWKDQKSLDLHHASPMMEEIAKLRDKYNLSMRVERFVDEAPPLKDKEFIRE